MVLVAVNPFRATGNMVTAPHKSLIYCPRLTLVAKQSDVGDCFWILFHAGEALFVTAGEESVNDDGHQNLILESRSV